VKRLRTVKSCEECNAKCCRTVAVALDKPTTKRQWEEIKWLVAHENTIVYKDNENDWVVEYTTNCKYIDENNKCNIYDKRPQICRTHKLETCVINGDGDYYKILFKEIDDVENYLKNKKKKNKNSP
jgi:uncharacterized protein